MTKPNDRNYPHSTKDSKGNILRRENFDGFWQKWERDANGKLTYFEKSYGYWQKWEYEATGKLTYFENSYGLHQRCQRVTKRLMEGQDYGGNNWPSFYELRDMLREHVHNRNHERPINRSHKKQAGNDDQ